MKKLQVMMLVLATSAVVGFQNCSKNNFDGTSNTVNSQSATSDGQPVLLDTTNITGVVFTANTEPSSLGSYGIEVALTVDNSSKTFVANMKSKTVVGSTEFLVGKCSSQGATSDYNLIMSGLQSMRFTNSQGGGSLDFMTSTLVIKHANGTTETFNIETDSVSAPAPRYDLVQARELTTEIEKIILASSCSATFSL